MPEAQSTPGRTLPAIVAFTALFCIAGLIIYSPSLHGLPLWDDEFHLTPPWHWPLIGLFRIWFDLGATQQYYPITHSIFWIQAHLWSGTTGYHVVNVLLHAFNAVLIWRIVRRLADRITGRVETAGLLAGAIFLVHPVHVESVAWISELKNTLSGFFYLAAMLCYLRHDELRQSGSDKRRFHNAAILLFILALLSKTVTASLPAAILVILWWRRGRLAFSDVRPLIVFFILGVSLGLFTAWVERTFIGAEGDDYDFGFVDRVLIAGRAVCFYLQKLLWPHPLIFSYPRWRIDAGDWGQWLFVLGEAALVGAAFGFACFTAAKTRARRAPLAALLFFIGTLFPALGFLNVFPFRYSFVADHFQYLASIGPIVLFSTAVCGMGRSWLAAAIQAIGVIAALFSLSLLSSRQSQLYADSKTLWQSVLARNPKSYLARNNLGAMLLLENKPEEAIEQFKIANEHTRANAVAMSNIGQCLAAMGRHDEALQWHQKAIKANPYYPGAYYNLANLLARLKLLDQAVSTFRRAIELEPHYPPIHIDLANTLLEMRQYGPAIQAYEKAISLNPHDPLPRINMASALSHEGRRDQAIKILQSVIQDRPDNAIACFNLANTFMAAGQTDQAITLYRKAVHIQPDMAAAHDGLATALRVAGRPVDALEAARRAVQLQPDHPAYRQRLLNLEQKGGKH